MFTEAQLNEMNGPQLVEAYNELAPTPVAKFKTKRVGVERVLAAQNQPKTEPKKADAVEKPKVEGPARSDAKARQVWVRDKAVDESQALNRKELAIFHGANPNGLVAKFMEAGGHIDQSDAAQFLLRFGTISKWPSVADTKKAVEDLKGEVIGLDAK
ncbi:hypothetical protein [Shimia thalassica]|uniref:hypothetical protein n=1 Tax=Shimia thalassica TaxID=1715693 RepID=UPI002734B4F2|nr:hypothetical protein [Shimia thalassica]MDP2520146.1 hypothetical protein [Shimia thalassica]